MRIVIVEDEVAIREGLVHLIDGSTEHCVVGKGKNGLEGIHMVMSQKPDLVITDIRMNEMDGLTMLSKLKESNCKVSSVILSGYSDFEYAREAIQLGVMDYLLKPITIDAVQKVLRNVEDKMEAQGENQYKQPEHYLRETLFGSAEESRAAQKHLGQLLSVESGQRFLLYCGYLGGSDQIQRKELNRILNSQKNQMSQMNRGNCLYFYEAQQQMEILLCQLETECQDFCGELERSLTGVWARNYTAIPWAMEECRDIGELQNLFGRVQKILSYSLTIGTEHILREQTLREREQQEFVYPMQLERKICVAVGNGEEREAKEQVQSFLNEIMQERYEPEDIRHGILKLMSQLCDTAKEINQKAFRQFRSGEYMKRVMQVYTREELAEMLNEICQLICEKERKGGISNYTINRTLEYIRTHFKEGITLEEMAEVLDITPEYLSTLFKREMGMNFSVFIKKFRISHAKRLLKGSNLKIYEIAEACGYSNSNYFTKVFKEEIGISPVEYR